MGGQNAKLLQRSIPHTVRYEIYIYTLWPTDDTNQQASNRTPDAVTVSTEVCEIICS